MAILCFCPPDKETPRSPTTVSNPCGHRSKSVDELTWQKFHLVITVCDDATEKCPIWLGEGKVTHISFPDPAEATGTDEEKLEVFRAVRDDIRRRVFYYMANGRVLIPGHAR